MSARRRLRASGIDRVYLSLDNQLSVDDHLLEELPNASALPPAAVNPLHASYRSDTAAEFIPERYRGYVFFLVVTDARRQ